VEKMGILTRTISHICFGIGLTGFVVQLRTKPFIRNYCTPNLTILIYHRVVTHHDSLSIPGVDVKTFEQQMAHISKNFNVLTVEDIVACVDAGKSIPMNALAVTFDDGYRDNYVNAFPILRKYRVPATIYLTVDCIGTKKPLWFDQVFHAIKHTQIKTFHFRGTGEKLGLNGENEKQNSSLAILAFMKRLDPEARDREIESLHSQLKVVPEFTSDSMLNWGEIQEMLDWGMRFGAHTLSHTILTRIPWMRARRELFQAKKIIEERIGQEVLTFAYPNGTLEDFNQSTMELVREAGYRAALTTVPHLNQNISSGNIFELGRLNPWEDHLPSFALKLVLRNLAFYKG
jgi:peptidoglycan/xylan/chitin deacetylase (PgdA/CDA1 family)